MCRSLSPVTGFYATKYTLYCVIITQCTGDKLPSIYSQKFVNIALRE
jgi:hypothetical protein